jgi:ArsR family transcriptional regulator, virulence genes transcriptional regulator
VNGLVKMVHDTGLICQSRVNRRLIGDFWQIGIEMDIAELKDNASRASELLKVMASESRLMILCNILEGEKSVQELQGHVGLSQSALSQQLAILRGQKLVRTRREAQSVYYSLASDEAETLIGTLYDIYCKPAT